MSGQNSGQDRKKFRSSPENFPFKSGKNSAPVRKSADSCPDGSAECPEKIPLMFGKARTLVRTGVDACSDASADGFGRECRGVRKKFRSCSEKRGRMFRHKYKHRKKKAFPSSDRSLHKTTDTIPKQKSPPQTKKAKEKVREKE